MVGELQKPFLKWAGGKRWLVSGHSNLMPHTYNRYFEPFLGSGALFFALQPAWSFLSDTNGRLINTYNAIKERPDLVRRYLVDFAKKHDKNFYYDVRQKRYSSNYRDAAHFIYLNRVCFNGIYRENKRGVFNVPLGTKTNVLMDDDFSSLSALLSNATIATADFEDTISRAEKGDFIFADPPYVTKHNTNGFIKYNQKIFSWSDQVRLAACLKAANAKGVQILLSNADHKDVWVLYEGSFRLESIERGSVIGSRAAYRGQVTELIATNA